MHRWSRYPWSNITGNAFISSRDEVNREQIMIVTILDIDAFLATDPSLKPRTTRTMRSILSGLARAAPTLDDDACIAWLRAAKSANTYNKSLNLMNRFRAFKALPPVQARRRPPGHRVINIVEATRACDNMLALHVQDNHHLALYLQRYSGVRPGELLKLRRRDVEFDAYSLLITPDDKTGPRRIRVLECTALMRAYLQAHDVPPGERLFPWSYSNYNHLLERWSRAVRSVVVVRPHDPRHVRATELARVLNENEMRLYFGWTQSSTMPAFYVHLAGTEHNDRLLELAGMKEAPAPVVGAVPCPRCHTVNNASARYCVLCGQSLDPRVLEADREHHGLSDAEIDRRIDDAIKRALAGK